MTDVQSLVEEVVADRRLLLDTMSRYNSWDVEGIRSEWFPMLRTRLLIEHWDKCWPVDTKRIKIRMRVGAMNGVVQSIHDLLSSFDSQEMESYVADIVEPARTRRERENGATSTVSARAMTERLMSMPRSSSTVAPRRNGTPNTGNSYSSCPVLGDFKYDGLYQHDGIRGVG